MASLRDNYERLFGRGKLTERVVFFSDAVFAIALTLLVIDLKVPEEYHGETSWDVIVSLVPGFIGYVISFTVIAINWTTHHRKFRVIQEFDNTLIWLNFVLLFFVAFVPFPTSLMSEYPGEIASVVLYSVVVMLLNLSQFALWSYAWRKKMMKPEVDVQMFRYVARNILVTPVVFGLSILIAVFWDPAIAMYSWILLWPASVIASRFGRG